MELDAVDLKVLAQIQKDSSLTNVELAKQVHLSPSPCLMRGIEKIRSSFALKQVRNKTALPLPD